VATADSLQIFKKLKKKNPNTDETKIARAID
jgi:hypothetical protein